VGVSERVLSGPVAAEVHRESSCVRSGSSGPGTPLGTMGTHHLFSPAAPGCTGRSSRLCHASNLINRPVSCLLTVASVSMAHGLRTDFTKRKTPR